jgi:arylsulfatase A-like enzyme
MLLQRRRKISAKKSLFIVLRIVLVFFFLQFIRDAFYRWDGYSYYMTFSDFLPHMALSYILWTVQGAIISFILWIVIYGLHRLNRSTFNIFKFDHIMFWSCFLALVVFTISISFKLSITEIIVAGLNNKILLIISGVSLIIALWLAEKHVNFEKILMGFIERIAPVFWFAIVILLLALPLSFVTLNAPEEPEKDRHSAAAVQSKREGPNIIVVVMDSLTVKDMELYGYERPTTPFLSVWSKDAVVFGRAYSQANWTTPASMSMLTGQRPWTHGVWYRAERHHNKKYKENVAQVLRDHGYAAYSFVQNKHGHPETLGVGDAFAIKDEAHTFWLPENKWVGELTHFFMNRPIVAEWMVTSNPLIKPLHMKSLIHPMYSSVFLPETVFNRFLEYISLHGNEPFFAWIHTYPPHELYLPPEPYMGMFGDEDNYNTAEKQLYSNLLYEYYDSAKKNKIDILRKRYDEFILYCDRELELFFERLNETVDMSNTVVIVTSDHGESFSHGYQGHAGRELYESLVYIPLIIKSPHTIEGMGGTNSNRIIDVPVGQIDLAPTILELAGISIPDWMEGKSLVPLMKGEKTEPRPVWSMQLLNNRSIGNYPIDRGTIAVWDKEHKLIFDIIKRESLLFNIEKDPDERKNLMNVESEKGRALLNLVENKLVEINESILEKR